MIIKSIYVASFGKLSNLQLDFNGGINVIRQNNGFGKSTIASFVRAMLYGLAYGNSKDAVNYAKRFVPWNSTDRFGGIMDVVSNGKTYRIERYFGLTPKQQTLSVTEVSTGKTLDIDDVGLYFTGLTADSYDRSAYFPQESVEISSNQNFDSKLANLVENSTQDYEKVQANLRSYKRNLKLEKGIGGKIADYTKQKYDLERQYQTVLNNKRRYDEIDRQLLEIAESKQALETHVEEIKQQANVLSAKLTANNLQNDTINNDKLAELQQRLDKVPAEFEQDKSDCDNLIVQINNQQPTTVTNKYKLPLTCVSLVAVIVGIIVALFNFTIGVVIGSIGLVAVILCSLLINGSTVVDNSAEISKYIAIAGKYVNVSSGDVNTIQNELWKLYQNYVVDKKEYQLLQANMGKGGNDEEIRQKYNGCSNLINEITKQINDYSEQTGSLVTEQKMLNCDGVSLTDKIDELSQQIKQAEHDYFVATTVSELLTQAKENLSSSYLPKLCNRVSTLLSTVTGSDYQAVIDRTFSVKLTVNGQTHDMESFSRGIREITLLCFRIALSELLYDGNIPFVIIDDAFVNYDDENFVRATKLLTSLNNTQVIYFTCHTRMGLLK